MTMEAIDIYDKKYTVRKLKNGTLILTPVVEITDKRTALTEYTDQELVNEMIRRVEENDFKV